MTGTLINVGAVLVGGGLGLAIGGRLAERVRQTVVSGLGLFTLAMGVRMFLQTQNPVIVAFSLLLGALLGEWWQIERGLQRMGEFLQARFARGHEASGKSRDFVRGFLTSSLLFCVGPMTILGSIQDGLVGDYHLLAVKSVLDGFAALAFASTFGVGVLFSVVVVFTYQGGISLLAAQARTFFTEPMTAEMSAVGGILLLALAISSLLELKPIRSGNLLPALLVAPLIVLALTALGWG